MSSPVSSRLRFLGEDALEGLVAGGVVGDAVLPAVPDDEQPGAGEEIVLGEAGKLLDFTQPVALLFVACLHHISNEDRFQNSATVLELAFTRLARIR